jgi:hypothetical protein
MLSRSAWKRTLFGFPEKAKKIGTSWMTMLYTKMADIFFYLF